MADERIGWEIDGRFYEHVGADGLMHGDFALIREVTGLTLDEFDEGADALATETGWLAVAVWHGDLDVRREQVVRMIERLPADAAKRVGWKQPVEDEKLPPAVDGSPQTSGGSSKDSDAAPAALTTSRDAASSEEPTPERSTLEASGAPVSRIGARA